MVPQTCKVCDHECENLCTQYTHVGPSYNPANAAFLGLCLLRPWTLEQVACALWGQNMGWAEGWAPCAGDRVYNTAPRLPSLLRFNCPASAKGNPLPVFPCLPACSPPRCSYGLRCPVAAHRAHRANHKVKKDTDAEENQWTKKTLNAIKPQCLCVILSSQVPFLPSQFHACVPIILHSITWKYSHDTCAVKVSV